MRILFIDKDDIQPIVVEASSIGYDKEDGQIWITEVGDTRGYWFCEMPKRVAWEYIDKIFDGDKIVIKTDYMFDYKFFD